MKTLDKFKIEDIQVINLTEARRNPDQNPKISAYEALLPYKDNPDIYISFTNVDKIGVNPQSHFNTPLGIYTYPLKEIWKKYNVDRYKSIGEAVPYAGDRPYIWVLERIARDKEFIEDLSKTYTERDFLRDIKILEKYCRDNHSDRIRPEDFKWFVEEHSKEYREGSYGSRLWAVTYDIISRVGEGGKSIQWNSLFRKVLGYKGVADKSGLGIIHSAEPVQTVFFTTRGFKVKAEFLNKNYNYGKSPDWILDANTKGESILVTSNEDVIWKSGTWEDGTWKKGAWKNGTWENGIWERGTWENGTWEDGVWENGLWKNGVWKDGTWENGIWERGTWEDGTWENGYWERGTWENGTWKDGTWKDGYWERGTWHNGTWEDGLWEGGLWKGGLWYDGTWQKGLWKGGLWKKGTWEDGTWENGTWEFGTWENGTWEYGHWGDGVWKGGTWSSGNWYNGTWEDGQFLGGKWLRGLWKGGLWANGTWENGTWEDGKWKKGTWKSGTWIEGIIYSDTYNDWVFSRVNPLLFYEYEAKTSTIEELMTMVLGKKKEQNSLMWTDLTESRRNPELNPRISAYEALKPYSMDPDMYISFTNIDKLGINPQSSYNTPLGIYSYPLKEIWKEYQIDRKNSVGKAVPFAGDAPYIWLFKVRSSANVVNDIYNDYTSLEYDEDRRKLVELIDEEILPDSRLLNSLREHLVPTIPSESVDKKSNTASNYMSYIEEYARSESRVVGPSGYMWYITYFFANLFAGHHKRQESVQWNRILRNVLGYDGWGDRSGRGIIHVSEPIQSVFFTRKAIEIVGQFYNKDYKTKSKPPEWLATAGISKDADYSIDQRGAVTWHGGSWWGGVFKNSVWENGYFRNGEFKNSVWENGEFLRGKFINSVFDGGKWGGGKFAVWDKTSTWESGKIMTDFKDPDNYYQAKVEYIDSPVDPIIFYKLVKESKDKSELLQKLKKY